MRKRKLYLSELLNRCKRKEYEVYLNDKDTTIFFYNIPVSIKNLEDTIYWDCQVEYWEVNENQLQIYL